MIPVRDINPRRGFPVATVVLIVLNILVFVYELLLPASALDATVHTWGLVPSRLVSLDVGALAALFTSMFLHSGFMHMGSNMLYLWVFGDNIEGAVGSTRFVAFYLLCGLGAALGQVLVNPLSDLPMIGASGAISGIMGAYLLLFPRVTVETLVVVGYFLRRVRLPAVVVLGLWIVMQLFSGVLSLGVEAMGGVAFFAHVGGFVCGVVLINLFKKRRWRE